MLAIISNKPHSNRQQSLVVAEQAFQAGDISKAEDICQQVVKDHPRFVDGWYLLGKLHRRLGRFQQAIESLSKAYALRPQNADILFELARAQQDAGLLEAAASSLRGVIRRVPEGSAAFSLLGNVLKSLGQYEEALQNHARACELAPDSWEVWSNEASTLLALGRADDAAAGFTKALQINPANAELHYNLGTALQTVERYEDACHSYERALAIDASHFRAFTNLGRSLASLGRIIEALVHLKRAVELAPNDATAQWNLALTLLTAGDFSGWRHYEWRRAIPEIPILKFDQPDWDGSERPDQTLLIHAEQGLGDTIQFARFTALARQKLGRVIFLCQPPLFDLLARSDIADEVLVFGHQTIDCDLQLPLLSLPAVLKITPETLPRMTPYLQTHKVSVTQWRERLQPLNGFKIGVCWQGNPKYKADHHRSIPLRFFFPLARIDGVRLLSLQQVYGVEQLSSCPKEIEITNPIKTGDDSADGFDAMAAIMRNLDLVITCDTSIAHLAGALGVPVWLLLAHIPDWRWGLSGERSLWYPSMRIFRQVVCDDWEELFMRVKAELLAKIRSWGCLTNTETFRN